MPAHHPFAPPLGALGDNAANPAAIRPALPLPPETAQDLGGPAVDLPGPTPPLPDEAYTIPARVQAFFGPESVQAGAPLGLARPGLHGPAPVPARSASTTTPQGQSPIRINAPEGEDTLIRLNSQITFANDRPLVLIGGMNVIESRDSLLRVAEHFATVSAALDIPFVFKASYDKANRSSPYAYRGPGLDAGLRLLEEVRATFGVPVLTDVHEAAHAAAVAQVADILQLPAFLARQTDLVGAVAATGAVVHVKKPQFLSPHEMGHIIAKCIEAGNRRVLLGERGSCFGYNNLVVDMLGIDLMKPMAPVVFDVTHALQKPGGLPDSADGRASQVSALARAGVAVGIAGLFIEAHPDPSRALCDGPSALPLAQLESFLRDVQAVDEAVKFRMSQG